MTNTAAVRLSDVCGEAWERILQFIGQSSPLCRTIMRDAKWTVDNKKLVITVNNNSSFLFMRKGMDKEIQNILREHIEMPPAVVFIDAQPENRENPPYIEKEVEVIRTLAAEVAASVSNISNKPAIKTDENKKWNNKMDKNGFKPRSNIKMSKEIQGEKTRLDTELEADSEILLEGVIFSVETRETKNGKLLVTFDMTDGSGSVTVKFFVKPDKYDDDMKSLVKTGSRIAVKGKIQNDEYAKELNIMALELAAASVGGQCVRKDDAPEKRVELHLHTQMSAMDAVTHVSAYVKRAAEWGHKAVAVTDHGVAQAFPDAMDASKGTGVKVIYGVEAYLVDDLGAVVLCPRDRTLDDAFVVFDIETTGLQKERDRITEIGAVKIVNGEITDSYSAMVNPEMEISAEITKLTGITNKMVADAPTIASVLPGFLEFIDGCVLTAHNASFDVGFITENAKAMGRDVNNTVLDTLELSRMLYPNLPRHKLNTVAQFLGIPLENHHRAVDDATAAAHIFIKCREQLKEKGVNSLQDINVMAGESINMNKLKYTHAIILAKNYTGLKNLYELISRSHINYFYKRPRIPKSWYLKLKEGLLIGTACEAGELYTAIRDNKPDDYIRELTEFYDYFEIQPNGNNMYLVREGIVADEGVLIDINKKIVELGEKCQKPVVATCDVHFIDPGDEVYRRIIMAGEGYSDADHQAPLFFRTTDEMLAEFQYLGEDKAREVVIHNTNLIADMIEVMKPMPDGTFPPSIDGAEEELKAISEKKARELYGDPLPALVSQRLERELTSIIKNGFAVMYVIAQKLVWKSLEDGYLVGSRGSVGSSFVATMAGITEVNPLPPHYLCPSCRYSDFDSPEVKAFAGATGYDMPDRQCPVCGTTLNKDGHDIPFETFLGFDGDKEPDIDLNFSGEYQAKAHAYTEELFGAGNVYKAGTIGTLADKTAYGYVKNYFDEKNITPRNAEINRLKLGCTGIKKTTGQHPGGLVIVPEGRSIYEFCPVQRPANDSSSDVTTTHFDYHAIKGRLLKLDILGHDVPTIIRMLHDITGIDPCTVPLADKRVMSLFTSPAELGVTEGDINCQTGSLGLPEFGTGFVRQMLMDTRPATFSELVRISGLSHGTGVWLGNAQELIKSNTATLKEIIPTRDDIMVYLINTGVEKKAAFKIMESVRKGYGVTDAEADIMLDAGVPEWYIDSCKKISYMFPKGHAVAYVMMTVRIGYYKVYYPYSFYASYFSVRSEDFDYEVMCSGIEAAREAVGKIAALGKEASAKEKNTLGILELVIEMYARRLKFAPLDLYEADAVKFKVTDDGLMPPLCSIQGLGVNAAQNIVTARAEGEFYTIEQFRKRTKVNKNVVELLKKHHILDGIPETNQLTLF